MQFLHKKIDYTVPSGHEGGPGIGKQWTPYVGTPYINMTAAQWAAVRMATGADLGSTWTLGGGAGALGGNTFMFVKAAAGLTLGQVVAAGTPSAGTVSAVTQTTAVLTQSFTTTAVNNEVDNWVWVHSAAGIAAGLPQLRRIKANNAAATGALTVALPDYTRPNSATDADVFDYIPVNGEVTAIIRPYNVIVCTATLAPVGIALGTVTSTQYTIIQVRGLTNVIVDGNAGTEGLVVDQPAWTAAAGAIRGANGVDNLYSGASLILPQCASVADVAAKVKIPCYVNFMAQ